MLTGSPASVLEARIQGNLPSLSPKLKQVATYCLQHARHLHLCRIQDVAQRCETQPVTVVRLAKRYGFRGFLDFKMAFLTDAGRAPTSAPEPPPVQEAEEHGDAYSRAVHLLQQARTVWMHAAPQTAQIAHCYADMLRVAGLTVQWMHTPMDSPANPWAARECDVLLSVALLSDPGSDFNPVGMAQRIGIPWVAITDGLGGCGYGAAAAQVCIAHLGQGLHGIPAGLALARAVRDARPSAHGQTPS
ncbi:transcriptional regulator, RpiR family [Rhodoferax sp. OV413]|uniref:MurR/RpiR family transcriptional regulator n=1 Tax=Rhodoferax sp. OV413 TaxID=1855285 RepID=UPI000882F1D8|nr:MurR/RpiR family transcriptional regulator [Rhodoferax sp. OV413]SDP73355.1 transcriptional regulator, RpiR family [Rhodoferax sp. OV413]